MPVSLEGDFSEWLSLSSRKYGDEIIDLTCINNGSTGLA